MSGVLGLKMYVSENFISNFLKFALLINHGIVLSLNKNSFHFYFSVLSSVVHQPIPQEFLGTESCYDIIVFYSCKNISYYFSNFPVYVCSILEWSNSFVKFLSTVFIYIACIAVMR